MWAAAAAAHGTRRFGVGRPYHRSYLLSGIIVCAGDGKKFQAQRQYRGRIPAKYLCFGLVNSGPSFCTAPRIPTPYLDDAVVDGIGKRLDRVLDRDELRRRLRAALEAPAERDTLVADLEARLRDTRLKIARIVDAIALGRAELPSLHNALAGPERQREHLKQSIARATSVPTRSRRSMARSRRSSRGSTMSERSSMRASPKSGRRSSARS